MPIADKKLDRLSFYDLIPESMQELLVKEGTEVSANKESIIFYEGEVPKHIYFILEGQVRLTKTSAEGKVFFLQKKKQYDLLGELSIFNSLKYQYNAEVTQGALLLRFTCNQLERLLIAHEELAVAFMKWLSKENQVMMAQFRDLVFCGKQGAVFSILVRLSNEYGQPVSQGILINRKITNQELANYVGATRESINRILKRLIKQKIISVNTKYITIHDLPFLQAHLRCSHCPFEECTI
ncbi:Crp/Fnr family transcriptional regulator [Salipaludibacillus agaradhaerens]|uniref:Crp/Fnr family transcriptional regulator n=1 Tax=Salipaludibacillus agaradhaerens TaxID=76935 RepID=UPI000995E1E8|nr:Crp/Fnr family transcriptional regulator [Salipaludibacillus agaradhaerens]MCR6107400.1 Crp/Fnr family transcriptional regulator [Salipaludibacillus agaradhaerens]MCR6119429.1 Crp/Fnr family transcriptional regulator [Salipaludibacillus agaradhaerens]UJW58458.1 Crp/Fnr family transcriptional regulator [Bacillus sp. A116_S68]